MKGFDQVSNNIFHNNNFFEFQTSTQKIFGKDLPISGGGYLRIFPWMLTKILLNRYCPNNELYTLYIHPFELSLKKSPPFPNGTNLKTKIRFSLGRKTVAKKLVKLIKVLQHNGFQFTTFSLLRQQLLQQISICRTD
jgi:hypothetical protein